jgi:hypothetical protein
VQEAKQNEPEQDELRTFALAVLEAAHIRYQNYHNYPSRLRELFYFDAVPSSALRAWVNGQLRQEIKNAIR